ncbi:AsmA family protein, partial [bacterium]|nr:AsmA family protein [bacterium]
MKRKLKKILKRIGRILIWILAGIVLIVLLLYAVQKVFFPEPKILKIASDSVRKTTGRELKVRGLSWNLLGSLDVTGVELGYTEAEGSWEQPLFSVEKVAVRFRILPLLRRRMEVADISIDRPAVHVVPELMKPGALTLPREAPPEPATADTGKQQIQPLPVSFSLSRFRLSDFGLNLTLPDTLPLTSVKMAGLCVELENLNVPRCFPDTPEGIQADLKCFTRGGRIRIEGKDFKESFIPDFEMLAQSGKDNRWSLGMKLGLLREKDPSGGLTFGLEMNGMGPADSVHLGRLSVSAGAQTLMRATGDMVMEERIPRFRVDFAGDSVRIGELIRSVRPLF